MKFTPYRLAIIISLIMLAGLGMSSAIIAQGGDSESFLREAFYKRIEADIKAVPPVEGLVMNTLTPCAGGTASGYPCEKIDLLANMPLNTIGATGDGNDIWGWTDSFDGKEYALMGVNNGTSFIDITDPENPVYLGRLPTHSSNSTWRDIKVYNNHAFVVSEASGHGMQVFDLTQLRNVVTPPVTFAETAHYNGFGSAHNLVINEDTGYAYAVGANCSGGLHMVNIQNPLSPAFAECVSSDGYTHDAQCLVYNGPDTSHVGQEICFNSNEDTLTIFDVTVKASPVQLSRTGYSGSRYTHQGWITEDHKYFLLDDELDEQNNGHNTRTYIWNITDLDNPVLIGTHTSSIAAIDHNQYIKGNYTFQANYRGGLRVLDISDIANANINEVAYFDTYPSSNNSSFNGAWSVYPFFDSGNIIISDIESGLFVVRLKTDISLQKTVGTDPNICAVEDSIVVNNGDEVTYCYTVENIGLITLNSHDLVDDKLGTLLSGLSFVLEPGETHLITESVVITQNVVNTAVWTATVDSQPVQATDSATVTLVAPAISLSKTVGTGGSCSGNEITIVESASVSYCYTVTNTGNVDLETHSLLDNKLGQLLSNTTYTLVPNESYTFITNTLIAATTVNSATWTAWQTGSLVLPVQASDVATVTVVPASYGVMLNPVSNSLYSNPGDTISYTLWLTNNGNITDSFDISVSGNSWDAPAPGTVGPVLAGDSTSFELGVTIPVSASNGAMDSLTILATSQGDVGMSASAKLTTTAVVTPIYALSTNIVGSGIISPVSGSYFSGTTIMLTATPYSGSTFIGWSGALSGTSNPQSLLIDGPKVVTATFSPVQSTTYSLTMTVAGGGVVTPTGGTYLSGTTVLLSASPNFGWTFSGWSGSIMTTTTPYSLLMDSNKVITATFVGNNKVYLPIVLK